MSRNEHRVDASGLQPEVVTSIEVFMLVQAAEQVHPEVE
jgi:hypothetical protein